MPWMETGAGHVELLVGLDNRQWLPIHVEDSWNPDDDMRLMKSVFGYRYMITYGWGKDLLPPDNSRGGPAGAQGGNVETAEEAQEVRLEEYRGWSQGTWSRENGSVQDAASPRGGCRGARPRSRRGFAARGIPATRRGASQRSQSREPGETYRGPPVPPAPFGMPHAQGKWGMLLRPKREIPPPKRRTPTNPPPAPSWGRQNRGGQGQVRAARCRPPWEQLLPNSGGIPGLLQSPGSVDPTQKLALMMAVMLLGMPPVHSCPTDAGPGAVRGGSRLGPRIHPSILTGESRGTLVTGEQNNSRTMHETSPMEQDESATLRSLQQTRLEMEKVGKMKKEIQEEKLEMRRAHQMEMEEMRRTFLLEMEEMKKTFQSNEKGVQETNQPQANIQRHLGEVWKPGDDGPILARVGGANLPADGGGTASIN
jgi:hypothetical protein